MGRGEWHLGEDAAEPIVRRAVEAGVTLFDTADAYSKGTGEELTGRLLGKFFGRREDYVLATKVRRDPARIRSPVTCTARTTSRSWKPSGPSPPAVVSRPHRSPWPG
ncbi:aldo/keto reductase [Kribbella sp. NPDC026596]|uniref:aldo/keto reductase n=1 Tax=Kribbella sp. NPDC026596 TaxID=3155122 RepID=UPI003411A96C